MIKFEHPRVAQACVKYTVLNKNGHPGEQHHETSP